MLKIRKGVEIKLCSLAICIFRIMRSCMLSSLSVCEFAIFKVVKRLHQRIGRVLLIQGDGMG